MRIVDLVSQSFKAIGTHKRRNFFSTFGIAWGVAAVLVLAGWGAGVKRDIEVGMSALGEDLVFVFPGHTSQGIGGYRAGRLIRLYPEDVEVIRAYASKIRTVIPVDQYYLTVRHGDYSDDRNIRFVMPEAKTLRNLAPRRGRFITPEDITERRRICVLGLETAKDIFGSDENPMGQEIRIGGIRFTVVGVLPEKQQMGTVGTRDENLIFIPFSTGRRLFAGRDPIWSIQAKPLSPEDSDQAVEEIRKALAAKYNFADDDEEAVFIFAMTQFTRMIDSFTSALSIFVAAVGAITLAIGGIGVTNMMLVSVNERIGEIGIRRAVGGTRRWILAQFMTETFLLTVTAGLVGLAAGLGILMLMGRLPVPDEVPMPIMSRNVTILAVSVMVATGLMAGISPARRAARLQPVQAIKGNLRALMPKMGRSRSVLPFPGLFGEIVSQAMDDIRTNRLRAALTGFGVFWGVAAVALLMGWGVGMKNKMLEDFSQLGGRRTVVYPRRIPDELSGMRGARPMRFTPEDIRDIETNAWYIEHFSPEIWLGFPVVEHGAESRAVHTLGVKPDVKVVRNFEIAQGRFINPRDVEERRKVAVLGHGVKQRLFGPAPALGQMIRIKGKPFKVVGVMTEKGEQTSRYTSLDDDKLLIPYSTAQTLSGASHPQQLQLHPTVMIPYEEVEERLVDLILENHDIEDEDAVGIFSSLEAANQASKYMDVLTVFLGLVGVITLLVGGAGVANVMMVSVSQRTREIGVRRAVGARKTHIFLQFLSEALMICAAGGIAGVLLALGVSKLLSVVPLPQMFSGPELNTLLLVVIFAFIVGAGVLSGLFPARRAAENNVIESLRYE
jgi:ABC-type antimicrobial peptide transport system permease subunit